MHGLGCSRCGPLQLQQFLSRDDGMHTCSHVMQVVERLVDLGADLHLVDNEGRTALHLGE